ncbi:MAG: CPBP family intramembrane metalloprotease, partial [Blautia sp.]|nr:CPBP family intramembrane metalloprotease [Blautia sp.]
MKGLIRNTAIAMIILLLFFFTQGAIVVMGQIEGTQSALIRGGVIWCLVVGTLLYFFIRNKNLQTLGFRKAEPGAAKKVLYYLPLLCIAFSNLICGFGIEGGIGFIWGNIFLTLGIGMAEEIYFRGIICQMWLERGKRQAILISSVLFGISHLMNIAGGAGPVATVFQICFAFTYGLVFAQIFLISRSLIPCIFLH